MKNPFGQIVSFEDYVDIIGIPKEQLNSEEVKNRINKWLVQATEQFDSMISGNGQLGRLYRWFEKLEDNEEDNYKKYKLIKAICSWVETFVIKGKFWVDGLPVINSNVDIQINSSSNDSNVEAKRKDIIQDLVSVGLYQTTNFGDNGTFQDNQQNAEQLIEDLIVLSTSELQQNYLRLNPQKSLEGNLDFANNDLVNGGNIIGSTQHARNNIQYYNIIDSTIDLNRNTILGSLPQDPTTAADIAQINQNIANINQEQITQNTNISNNENEINSLKAKDTEQNNRITALTQEVNTNKNNITNLATVQNQHDQLIQTNTNKIQENKNNITALDGRLVSVSGLLTQTIDGLRTLKPFQYVGEYQNGTSYNINQLVSYNNNLYLSKEDNNNTTPPSDKWLLINKDTISVDLSDYPTKLEVEAIKNNLQQSITSNTTNITNNQTNITNLENRTNTIEQNYVSKTTTTPQTIASQITFTQTDMVLKFNSGTNNSAYLAGFKSNNQRIWYFGKGSSTSDNFIIGADRGVIKLEPSTHVDVSNKRIINVATPTAINDAANKQYVDNLNNQNVKLAGDQSIGGNKTFTQPLTVATPTQNTHAATKAYVDNAIQNITPGSGGSIDTSNFATLNTTQTITGAKTFNNNVVISKNPTPLILKANNNDKTYMVIKSSDDTTNFSLGANSSNTSLEVNRGDLTLKTLQSNKNVNFENVARVKLNRSVLETGTEINAGYGGLNVKFIPEDNSTKTLQFYNANATDQRRFNLLIAEPTQAQNPATKNYVDTAIAGINTSGNVPQQTLDQINNNTTNITNLQSTVNTNTNSINTLNQKDTQNVKLSGNQTINGTKTFTNQIVANGGITNLPNPTNATDVVNKNYVDNNTLSKTATAFQTVQSSVQFIRPITVQTPTGNNDAANKQYVDNQISQIPVYNKYNLITSNNGTFNNLQILTIDISRENSLIDKSWIIQFDRKGNNGNKYEGTINYNFLLPEINQATFAGNSFWYNSTNKKFDTGANAGITILRTNANTLQLTIQCWDGGNRISKIRLYAPK